MKRIILKTAAYGPDLSLQPGEHTLDDKFADALVQGKYAEYAVSQPPERAVVKPSEKAVVKPPEVSDESKPSVPVVNLSGVKSSNVVGSNKAPAWGTPKSGG